MPGFMGIVSDKTKAFGEDFDIMYPVLTERKENVKRFDNVWFKRSIVDKFVADKVFFEDEEIFICSDGLMLNSKELRNKFVLKDNFHLLKRLYRDFSEGFPSELRGDFDGVIYDKKDDSWVLYTNHIGSKWIFYYFDRESKTFIFGTELKMVVAGMRALKIKPELCEVGAYFLLTFGYMLDDFTLIKRVKKIRPGSVLVMRKWNLETKEYYKLSNTPYIKDSEEKIIKKLDERYRAAIKAEYDKDLEYGYRHIATLSGGLDSRMNVCYAKKLGYKDILNITFSQSNYLDEQIAKKIASDWGYDFLFYSLDNGNYLKDVDLPTLVNDGLVLYSGSAHALKMQSLINGKSLGLQHNGILGGAAFGTYAMVDSVKRWKEKKHLLGAYSTRLIYKIEREIDSVAREAESTEIFLMTNRGYNGIFNGLRVAEQFTEYASPTLHKDFIDYAFRLEPKHRKNQNLYLRWILKMSPEAAKYPWEKTGLPIGAGKLRRFVRKGMKYAGRKIFGCCSKSSMNPFNYWYKNNRLLREAFDSYFNKNIELLSAYPELQKDTRLLFNEGTPLEKTQALTLLASMRLHDLGKEK